jgi:lysyl-tRNA synthetase class 2
MSQIRSIFYRSSSFITNVSWDPDSEILLLRFVSGSTWAYHDVPEDIYEALVRSPSVGEYFNKHVRNKYASESINFASSSKGAKNGKKKQEVEEKE